ncbi:MAG: hypothetical protein KGO53_05285 [Alphaproteobacteria bacterium]|nr:hypothetical protein [Alphaproteobacteria bacterium]
MGEAAAPVRWAFVTPSYLGDLQRCELLCRSMDVFLKGPWHHYVVVDKPHYQAFKHLAGPRRSVWLTDDVAPGGMRLLFNIPFIGGRSVWWSRDIGVSLGWHLQQMIKIGIAEKVSEEGLAYCDSDTFFLQPFDVADLTRDGRFRFYRSKSRSTLDQINNPKYVRACLDILRLDAANGTYHGYIDNFVTWHRPTVLQMCELLAQNYGGKWSRSLRNRIQISEYMLYGLFVDEVQKSNPHLFHTSECLCKTQWFKQEQTDAEVEAFCSSLLPNEVTVGVQSFAGVSVDLLARQFEKAAKALG